MPFKPPGGSTNQGSVYAIFGETNPSNATDTPRVAGRIQPRAEQVASAPLSVLYGRQGGTFNQTDGMSTLFVDQVQPLPAYGIQTDKRSVIGQSSYAPFVHYRAAFWLFSRWDPIQRFTNTFMDVRWRAPKVAPLTNVDQRNLPFGARMGQNYSPFGAAQLVPRFSTEPFTIIPQAGQ